MDPFDFNNFIIHKLTYYTYICLSIVSCQLTNLISYTINQPCKAWEHFFGNTELMRFTGVWCFFYIDDLRELYLFIYTS